MTPEDLEEIRERAERDKDYSNPIWQWQRGALVLDLLTHIDELRAELTKWKQEVGKACTDIPVAGPISHRVRMLHQHYSRIIEGQDKTIEQLTGQRDSLASNLLQLQADYNTMRDHLDDVLVREDEEKEEARTREAGLVRQRDRLLSAAKLFLERMDDDDGLPERLWYWTETAVLRAAVKECEK